MKTLIFTSFLLLNLSKAYAHRGGGAQQEGFREAMEACHEELGTERPERGQRPSEEEREAMKSCLSAKGIEMPERGPRGQGGQRGARNQDSEEEY
ncbi:MAG: hypothetical protein CME60_03305 [Halobacteriovoraceae bacterium]|nr:hypothetical protein [Halobacteriovoraceae bacterium]|tara:strand:+ start:734 stop:1018 length:285 start_codon:yes stop_codon:yes gene_type:complete